MDRAKVICHMMTTIDGKIVIDWDGNKDYELAGMEYDRLIYGASDLISYSQGRKNVVKCREETAGWRKHETADIE